MLISWGFHDLSITKEWWLNRSPQSYGDIGMIIGMILKMEGVFFLALVGVFRRGRYHHQLITMVKHSWILG